MREMKDSGIEWIGKIPIHWTSKPLKFISKVYGGATPSKAHPDYWDGTIPWVSSGEVKEHKMYDTSLHISQEGLNSCKQILMPVNSVVIVVRSGILNHMIPVALLKTPMAVNQDIKAFVFENELISKYFVYFIEGLNSELLYEFKKEGTTVESLDVPRLLHCPVILPPQREMQDIVNYLDARCAEIDSLTADIKEQIDVLEQYKKSAIFDAVSGRMSSTPKEDTGSEIWKEIPCNWQLVDIKYLFEIVKRIAGKEGYDILSVTQKGIRIKDITNNEGQIAENYSGYQFVYPTDYVMNHMDLLTGWVDCSSRFGVTSPDYRVFRLRDRENNNFTFWKYVMQCCYSCRIFYSLGQGVSNLGRWRLQTSTFLNFKVPDPPLNEQNKIAEYLEPKCAEIDSIISTKEDQLETLSEYKKSLIYEYVTGKKEVPAK